MKRLFAFALSLGLVAAMAVPVMADVDRNQITTDTYTASVNGGVNPRSFSVEYNPCDGSAVFTNLGPYNEWFLASSAVVGGNIRIDLEQPSGYTWGGVFPVGGGDFSTWYGDGVRSGNAVLTSSASTDYENHGQYVQAMGGGVDVAHSCIGKPVQAQS